MDACTYPKGNPLFVLFGLDFTPHGRKIHRVLNNIVIPWNFFLRNGALEKSKCINPTEYVNNIVVGAHIRTEVQNLKKLTEKEQTKFLVNAIVMAITVMLQLRTA